MPTNPAEAFVQHLCKDAFLSLFSVANPMAALGKELCDVLVVCAPDVIIFSVQNVTLGDHESVNHARGAVDSLVMDRQTLQPIRETRSLAGGRVRVQYSTRNIHASLENDHGDAHMRDKALTTPTFASSELDDIARTLPLSLSYRGYADLYYPYPAPFSADRAYGDRFRCAPPGERSVGILLGRAYHWRSRWRRYPNVDRQTNARGGAERNR